MLTLNSTCPNRQPASARMSGFSLIEAMVAMIILSVGVLALSVLHLSSLQNTQGGHMRSQATMLAYDILDAMRANLPATVGNNYVIGLADNTPEFVNCYGSDVSCNTTQLADSDVNRWRNVLAAYLPAGNGQIATATAGGITTATVTVQWIDPYSAETGAEQVVLQASIR